MVHQEMRILLVQHLATCLILTWTITFGDLSHRASNTIQKTFIFNKDSNTSDDGSNTGGGRTVPDTSENTLIIVLSLAAFTLVIVLASVLCFVYLRMVRAEKARKLRRARIRARAREASAQLLEEADQASTLSSTNVSDIGSQGSTKSVSVSCSEHESQRSVSVCPKASVHFSISDTVWDPQSNLHTYRMRRSDDRFDSMTADGHRSSALSKVPRRKVTPLYPPPTFLHEFGEALRHPTDSTGSTRRYRSEDLFPAPKTQDSDEDSPRCTRRSSSLPRNYELRNVATIYGGREEHRDYEYQSGREDNYSSGQQSDLASETSSTMSVVETSKRDRQPPVGRFYNARNKAENRLNRYRFTADDDFAETTDMDSSSVVTSMPTTRDSRDGRLTTDSGEKDTTSDTSNTSSQ